MKSLLMVVFAVALSLEVTAQNTIIHCGRLIDGRSNEVRESVSILVSEDRIVEIKAGYAQAGRGDRVIDLKDKTVLPGLMDMHTHLSGEYTTKSYAEKFFMNPDEYAYRSVPWARRTLMAGFTTVRELGGAISTSLRDAIEKGYVVGPRIFSAGKSIATTGGHADPTNSLNAVLMGDPGPNEGVINSIEDAKQAVRQRYKNGADHIKITATGGVLSVAKSGQNPQFTEEEVRAIVETAKDYEMHVPLTLMVLRA